MRLGLGAVGRPRSETELCGLRSGLDQCDRAAMSNEFRVLGIVAESQGEQIAVTRENDGLPPPNLQGFVSENKVPWGDLLPGAG